MYKSLRHLLFMAVTHNAVPFFTGVVGTILSIIFIRRPRTELPPDSGLSAAQPLTDSMVADLAGWGLLILSLAALVLALWRSRR